MKCPVCEKELSKIDVQHLKKHQLSKEQYFEKYGIDAPFGYSQELKNKKSGENHPRFGKKVSTETKQKISNSVKSLWDQNLVSENQKNALGKFSKNQKENGNHFNLGRTFNMSDEQKKSISSSLINYYKENPKTYSENELDKWNSTTKYKIAETRKNKTILKYINNLQQWADDISLRDEYITCQCRKCNTLITVQTQTVRKHQFSNTLCHTCFPIFGGTSQLEEIIATFLSEHNIKFERHNRQQIAPLELDFFIPELNLAIEIDGIYWHSDLAGYDNNKHLEKTERCLSKNIQLIHIFENELIYKRDIVFSRLLSKIKNTKRIYARKCEICEVSSSDAKKFFFDNHIQGYSIASVFIGLKYENEIIAVMSFGKPRFSNKVDWELIRYASKLDFSVIGGASRLLNYFEKNFQPSSLISYADRRWSNGNLYRQLGFSELKNTAPSYYYFKQNIILENRMKYQKHKLSKILSAFDENKTEWENMKENGYNRIWDCGNLVFIKNMIK